MILLNNEQKEITILDLGKVKVGDSKEYTYILYNDVDCTLENIEIKIANKEVTVLSKPEVLSAFEKAEIRLKWTPIVAVKPKGLKTSIQIDADEVYK